MTKVIHHPRVPEKVRQILKHYEHMSVILADALGMNRFASTARCILMDGKLTRQLPATLLTILGALVASGCPSSTSRGR